MCVAFFLFCRVENLYSREMCLYGYQGYPVGLTCLDYFDKGSLIERAIYELVSSE